MILQRSTAEVGAARRFDFWPEAICEVFVELEPHSTDRNEAGGFLAVCWGCTVAANTHEVGGTPPPIRRTGEEFLFLSVLLTGDVAYAQDDRVAELVEPGQFVLHDTA